MISSFLKGDIPLIRKQFSILLALLLVTLTGCSSNNKADSAEYQTITASEAKEMMDQRDDLIILDVRTKEEYNSGHIPDAILLPNDEIKEKAESLLEDKDATILIYCRSGRRSALAAKDLVELGYTDIIDFGGINDWTYDIVTD